MEKELDKFSIKELEDEVLKRKEVYIDNLLETLKKDPMASEFQKNYKELKGYLLEMAEKEKNGSILSGLITAIEKHLNK